MMSTPESPANHDLIEAERNDAQRRAADYAMVLDLMGAIAQLQNEDEAIDNIFDVFATLFAPGVLAYVPVHDGEAGEPRIAPAPDPQQIETALWSHIAHLDPQQGWMALERGFILSLRHGQQTLGIVFVDDLAFPEHRQHYLNLALTIADVCGLALNNARTYRQMQQAETQLRAYSERLEQMVSEKVQELEIERAKSLQTAKLAAIGEMATGVAHELNQPLTAMLFDAEYLRKIAERARANPAHALNPGELHDMGDNLVEDIARCRRIIDHLRAFGRIAPGAESSIDLNHIIEDSFILIRERLRQHGVDVQRRLAPNLPIIQANAHKLEQVFLNLYSNAEYAMAERAASLCEPGDEYEKVLRVTTRVEGEHIVAQVWDNGCGMTPEVLEHLFQPFFTTKPVGEGTGLGLSIAYGIVTEAGGEIACESSPGEGTLFTLRFPIEKRG